MKHSKGEFRVGTSFNPSASGDVDRIKSLAAELIDLIDNAAMEAACVEPDSATQAQIGIRNGEIMRLSALAQTSVEEAAMWGVKAVTKRVPEVEG